jgi:hypothetical protein
MTDPTIEMAREAKAMLYCSPVNHRKLVDIMFTPETLKTFEGLIRTDERKKIAYWYDKSDAGDLWSWVVEEKIRTGGYLND